MSYLRSVSNVKTIEGGSVNTLVSVCGQDQGWYIALGVTTNDGHVYISNLTSIIPLVRMSSQLTFDQQIAAHKILLKNKPRQWLPLQLVLYVNG